MEARDVSLHDPEVVPLLADLADEYDGRYPGLGFGAEWMATESTAADFAPPSGAFVVLVEDGRTVAGGAFRRVDDTTADLKRIWVAPEARRRGLGRQVLAELEPRARALGYRRFELSTGPNQPEAVALYLAAGYEAHFDVAVPPTDAPLPFSKELAPAADPVARVE